MNYPVFLSLFINKLSCATATTNPRQRMCFFANEGCGESQNRQMLKFRCIFGRFKANFVKTHNFDLQRV